MGKAKTSLESWERKGFKINQCRQRDETRATLLAVSRAVKGLRGREVVLRDGTQRFE